MTPREIAAATTAKRPFWSPDGKQIGYQTDAGLSRISAEGGTSSAIPSTVTPSANSTAAWTADGRIIFVAPPAAQGIRATALYAVPVSGGTATKLTPKTPVPNEQAQRYPVALPDGGHFVYHSWTIDPADRGVYLGTLDSGERHLLVKSGFRAGFVAPDILVYVRDRVLVAQRFSVADARMIGTAVPVATSVARSRRFQGRQIAYATHRASGLADVWIQGVAGNAVKRIVASGPQNFHPIDWAADGTLLLHSYATGTGADDLDLYTLAPGPSSTPQPLDTGVARGSQAQGQFSHDGRWIAYASDESGQLEVYVQPRSGGGARTQVSSDAGGQPRWRGDGRELFYVSSKGEVMSVPLSIENGELTPGRPAALFSEPSLKTNNTIFFYGGAAGYDVSADGDRFLVNRMIREPGAGPMYVILNWTRPQR